jgi:poly(3-hydroxybutyrate) depolymerase
MRGWLGGLAFAFALTPLACGGGGRATRGDASPPDGGGQAGTGRPSPAGSGGGGVGGEAGTAPDGGGGPAGSPAPAGTGGGQAGSTGQAGSGGGAPPDAGGTDAGASEVHADAAAAETAGRAWTPACPASFVPAPGVNTGFPTPTGARSFSLNLPADLAAPRPVWVPLTGSVESTNENLDARGGNRKLTANGYIVIGPVRRCAGTVDGAGTAANGGACNTGGTGGWTWNPWNEGRAFGAAGDPWKIDEGPDSQFLEAIIKCVATKYPVDQRRLFVGGISSGGTMTNRALTFRSDFWAGGMPISGEWYVTRDDGTSWGADDFSARRAAVAAAPTKIYQGRVGPFLLKTALDPMIVITVWGGNTDLWNCGTTLCADYRPTTQVGSNYFSSMPNVVHVACSATHGHQWPTVNRDAFNLWALTTLSSHPKGTPKADFVLTPPPAGYTCKLGVYTDHY